MTFIRMQLFMTTDHGTSSLLLARSPEHFSAHSLEPLLLLLLPLPSNMVQDIIVNANAYNVIDGSLQTSSCGAAPMLLFALGRH